MVEEAECTFPTALQGGKCTAIFSAEEQTSD
jgi:hypothetical protein